MLQRLLVGRRVEDRVVVNARGVVTGIVVQFDQHRWLCFWVGELRLLPGKYVTQVVGIECRAVEACIHDDFNAAWLECHGRLEARKEKANYGFPMDVALQEGAVVFRIGGRGVDGTGRRA